MPEDYSEDEKINFSVSMRRTHYHEYDDCEGDIYYERGNDNDSDNYYIGNFADYE